MTERHDDNTPKVENTDKRDALVAIEKKYQRIWAETRVFEENAPSAAEVPFHALSPAALRAEIPKFFGTIAYPYMNGTLHIGHGFTISKVEFATGYARMQGKRALFPLGFHCTGMAIKACADKLVREIEDFGRNFERFQEQEGPEGPEGAVKPAQASEDVTKFKSKKSKSSAKSVEAKYQFQIMLSQGIPREDIHRFADPYHWVHVFPEAGMKDITNFGLRIDWRRSFVTTDANPYYDSFVCWQMNSLKDLGKIKFGKRYTMYSPKDEQPCLDHDRSEGEGVGVQEYTAVKMRVLQWSEGAESIVKAALPSDATVYFVPATLRPETMYGQTCCFVGPAIAYGIFPVSESEYLFVSERAARNMAFQGIFPVWGHYSKVLSLRGSDVVGTLVDAPLSVYTSGVRVLPMDTLKETKGTGVVTSVPSDSPDDYATVTDLANKAEFYNIRKEWAQLEIVPIIETPTYGSLTAPFLVEQMKIRSPKDPKLAEAKEAAYKEGFYHGKMIYGDFHGMPVQEAKDLVKRQLKSSGLAFDYCEPDGLVISRSKDECVAALLDQWYLNYGSAENGGDGQWCDQVLRHLNSGDLNTFSPEAKHQFAKTLAWLGQWACARSYGLGSKLPWDPAFLVESLSDSTVYPSYYTVAHYLHRDLYGKERGIGNVSADQMSDGVWDYIFTRTDKVDSDIPQETLQSMRREFEYWYPVDLRVSGKELIQNHLTFFLYTHVALWPQEYWPKGIRPNGHLLRNGEKMSKSTGNFLTLSWTVEKFGADAARIALADAGDAIEDANFEESVANRTILKLFELKKWLEEMIRRAVLVDSAAEYVQARGRNETKNHEAIHRTGEAGFWDKLFESELDALTRETESAYDGYFFKNALRHGFYDLTAARDFYREATRAAGVGMHHDLVRRYAELQALLLAPIAPHWAEYVWLEVLGNPGTIQRVRFPAVSPVDPQLRSTLAYIRATMSGVTSAAGAQQKRLAKGKSTGFDPKKAFKLSVFYASSLPAWQEQCIGAVRDALEEFGVVDVKTVSRKMDKNNMKRAMPFVQTLKKLLDEGGNSDEILGAKLLFDEESVLREMVPSLLQTLHRCEVVHIVKVSGDDGKSGVSVVSGETVHGLPAVAGGATPGNPRFHFENLQN